MRRQKKVAIRIRIKIRNFQRKIFFEIAKGVLLALIDRQQRQQERERYKVTIHKGIFFDTETWEEK